MSDFSEMPSKSALALVDRRLISSAYLPSSADGSSLDLVTRTSTSIVSVSMPTNTATLFGFKVMELGHNDIVGVPDIKILAGTNIVPSPGAGSANWSMAGPILTPYDATTGEPQERWEQMARLVLFNFSGVTTTVRVECTWTTIINRGGEDSGT